MARFSLNTASQQMAVMLQCFSSSFQIELILESTESLLFCCASTLTAMRVCICVAVSTNDLHTECLWHREALPSQICLKHCHNKPLNQALVCAPSKAPLFLSFLQTPSRTFYHRAEDPSISIMHRTFLTLRFSGFSHDTDESQNTLENTVKKMSMCFM